MPDEKKPDQSKEQRERQEREQKEREAPTPKPPQENPPPADGEEGQETTEPEPPKPAAYAPITPDDGEENPVEVEVPKTDQDVAEEGTALAEAKSVQTGGNVPFLSTEPIPNKRIWALDAAHNTNDRGGGRGAEHPDLVETAQ